MRTNFVALARCRIDGDHRILHVLQLCKNLAVITGQRIEIFLHLIHSAESLKFTGFGIETGDGSSGVGADPDHAIGRFCDPSGEGDGFGVDRAKIFQTAFGILGIIAIEMTIPGCAHPDNPGANAAHAGRHSFGPGFRHEKLAAVTGLQIDIDNERTSVILAHRSNEGGFAIGRFSGMKAHPIGGFDRNTEFANDRIGFCG